ncbi:TraB/GumN family protein [Sphingomonas koreensis]|nr:TraB/GumN family protein [Sphingomonas koreensis]
MIKHLSSLLAGAALFVGAAATAQTAPPSPAAAAPSSAATQDADPALWVVKDKDTTIYLFGTVHVLKPGMTWFDEAVKSAFDASDTLVLEMVMPDMAAMQALVTKFAVNSDSKTLTDKLPAADRAAFTSALTDLGAPAGALDHYDPWFAATELALLPIMKLGYNPANGPEAVLTAAAKAAGKPVAGLETPEQQLGYLDGLPEDAQITFLDQTVKDIPKASAEIDAMVADWAKGDPDALAKIMNDDLTMSAALKKTLLTDRNARWADWIATRMKTPGTVFIAVGAGHLAGAGSVQNDLAKQHLKATRIAY